MMKELTFDSRFKTPPPEKWAKVLLSQKEAELLPKRELKCPICDFPVAKVFSHTGYVDVKCRKCKFAGVLNLEYFRRQRSRKEIVSN
jgi:phage FluMu protein Com